MAGSLNKVMIIGNLGADPDVRSMTSGDEVCNLSIATSESWNDKASGEKKERTQWHKIVIFNPNLVKVAKNYLKKGSKVYIEGQIETRKWTDKEGKDQYTTEIVLRPYRGELTMLDGKGGSAANDGASSGYSDSGSSGGYSSPSYGGGAAPASRVDEMADDIPF
ncbi:MAG: single-stranded DNA-binding protein [Alphaproteobacteria bacterium RIFCSPHIGHO2_12_FULL_45_9]|nr:MAG: single-stranded DNA-binding protein [Alphaproteobacteria bacterium RIFCSPHIGHO2_02_FULL_46_13]OFW97514.1 MAG: single-stranded DNA-binding protein [Alphaproteobacteria bacterium RIFCSPHIGHO2_12_FULL_45_9]